MVIRNQKWAKINNGGLSVGHNDLVWTTVTMHEPKCS